MIEQKNEGILGIDIWNNVQSFYGNNLSLTFGNNYINIRRLILLIKYKKSFATILG